MKHAAARPLSIVRVHSKIAIAIAIAIGAPLVPDAAAIARPLASDQAVHVGTSGRSVANCDDGGSGSLRDAIANAAEGDIVDLTQLTCSTITLTSGEIEVLQDSIAIEGPGADELGINGNLLGRVFRHTGTGTFSISGVELSEGRVAVPAGDGDADGGCVLSDGTVTLDSVYMHDCTAYSAGRTAKGGCLEAMNFHVSDSRVTGCLASVPDNDQSAYGGAFELNDDAFDGALAHVERSVISGNQAVARTGGAHGGAIHASSFYAQVEIIDSTLDGNRVFGAPYTAGYGYFSVSQGIGGAIGTQGAVSISGSTLSNNTATSGGAIGTLSPLGTPDNALVVNSTISGNTASSSGGGIWALLGGVHLISSTVTRNYGQYGGGGIMPLASLGMGFYDNAPDFESSIVALNTSQYHESDIFTDSPLLPTVGANNIIGPSAIQLPPDTMDVDPRLLPLADNGGPTATHALAADSPAIDHGNNSASLDYDQRGDGFPRVVNKQADIGAFEYSPPTDVIFASGFE